MDSSFSTQSVAFERSYSSQDSQSLRSILDAGGQSSYSSRTSLEDLSGHLSGGAEGSAETPQSNDSDFDSQLNLSTVSLAVCQHRQCLPFGIDLLSDRDHFQGSDHSNGSYSNDPKACQLQIRLDNTMKLVEDLQRQVSQLEKTEVGWKIQVQVLEAKLATSNSMYNSLLERVDSWGTGTKTDTTTHSHSSRPTFHNLLLDLRKRNSELPPCPRPKGTFYWMREEWNQEYQNGRGILSVSRRPNESATSQGRQGTGKGLTPFIIDKDGYIADATRQAQMRDHMQSLWQTLAFFDLAPTSWSKATSLAMEFVALSMRLEYKEFQLCDRDWKTDAFATRHYPNWKGNPHSPATKNVAKQEEAINSTQKAIEIVASGPTGTTSKRPHLSPTYMSSPRSPSTIHRSKKKKDEHVISGTDARISFSVDPIDEQDSHYLIDAPTIHGLKTSTSLALQAAPLSRADPLPATMTATRLNLSNEKPSDSTTRSWVNVANPLSQRAKGCESPTVPPPTVSAGSSTTDLTQQFSNTRVSDPNDVIVPPTSGGRMDLFQRMSESFRQATTTSLSEPKTKGNSGGQQRHTAKNICRQEYMEQNSGKSASQFNNYWRKLPEEQKKLYADKLEASKAKMQAKGKGKATPADDEAPSYDDDT